MLDSEMKPFTNQVKKMVNAEGLASRHIQLMNAKQIELYERIQSFSLDKPNAQLSFSKRLARDNGWTLQYAQRVIEEYKKFAFLAVAAGHPVTPSDQIDQAWHLHLTYTRSYWDEFCSEVLQTPLHHEPTLGGQAENQKFDDWYSKTLESYEHFFSSKPPVEIWPAPEDRFGQDLHFKRINTQQNWVFPKLKVHRKTAASIAILLPFPLSGCYMGSSSNINPITGFLLALVCVSAGFGAIKALFGTIDLIKNPSRPRIGGDGGYNSNFGGIGGCSDSGTHSADSSDGGCGGGCGGCGGCGG